MTGEHIHQCMAVGHGGDVATLHLEKLQCDVMHALLRFCSAVGQDQHMEAAV